MKIFLISLCLILCFNLCYSQNVHDDNIYHGILSNLLINHQPYAKSEAMGRGLVANYEGDFGSYYNPALTSLSKGVNFNSSYTQENNVKPSLAYLGASYSNEKFGSIGVSSYYFSKRDEGPFARQHRGAYYDAIHMVNYSKEVFKGFYAGINVDVYHYSDYVEYFTIENHYYLDDGFALDLGVLKKFSFESPSSQQVLQFGAALYNITNSKVTMNFYETDYKSPLPATFRIGAGYQLKVLKGNSDEEWNRIKTFTHIEYEKIINAESAAVFKAGQEVIIEEIFSVRAGLYFLKPNQNDSYNSYAFGDEKNSYRTNFNAGFAINLPLNQIFKIKSRQLNLKFDYVKAKLLYDEGFYSYYGYEDNGDYYTLGLSINYIP